MFNLLRYVNNGSRPLEGGSAEVWPTPFHLQTLNRLIATQSTVTELERERADDDGMANPA